MRLPPAVDHADAGLLWLELHRVGVSDRSLWQPGRLLAKHRPVQDDQLGGGDELPAVTLAFAVPGCDEHVALADQPFELAVAAEHVRASAAGVLYVVEDRLGVR